MTPREFIESAYAEVQALTDEGDQMHRRAVRGKPLYVHLHGWDRTAFERSAPGGMTELEGGRAVTLRVQGQYMDRGARYTARTTEAAVRFVETVERLLAELPPPVPEIGRPELPADEKTKPRTIRLNDERWEKLQRLGRDWLEPAIDRAKEPDSKT